MGPEGRRKLAREYRRLVARAAGAGLLAAAGLTPREQSELLLKSERLPADELSRLAALVERGLYAGGGNEADADEAVALCRRLAGRLPHAAASVVGIEGPAAHRGGRREGRFPRLGVLFPRLAPVVILSAALYGLTHIDVGCSSGSVGGGAPASSYQSERAAVSSVRGGWKRAPTRRRVIRARPERVLTSRRTRPSFDTGTGVDIDFVGVPDPFRPRLSWTHRREVFPFVDDDYRFAAADGELFDAMAGEDVDGATQSFRASVEVNLRRNVATPLPSPAPDAVVITWDCSDTSVGLEFVKDAADALYVIADKWVVVELEYTLATYADYHFAPLPDVPFEPVSIDLPEDVRASAEEVLDAIGGLPAATYGETLRRLHAYFAGFSVCPVDAGEQRENDYLTLALSRKGVCRHRARTFCITAQALGVPARLAENRVHSFAEVQLPSGNWRRLEFRLGEGERPPVPHTAAARAAGAWDGESSGGPVPWAIFVALTSAVAVVVLLARRQRAIEVAHVTLANKGLSRPDRRARRDHDQSRQAWALGRLLAIARFRVAARLGAVSADVESLREAADQAGLPAHVRPRLDDLLTLDAKHSTAQSLSATDIHLNVADFFGDQPRARPG